MTFPIWASFIALIAQADAWESTACNSDDDCKKDGKKWCNQMWKQCDACEMLQRTLYPKMGDDKERCDRYVKDQGCAWNVGTSSCDETMWTMEAESEEERGEDKEITGGDEEIPEGKSLEEESVNGEDEEITGGDEKIPEAKSLEEESVNEEDKEITGGDEKIPEAKSVGESVGESVVESVEDDGAA
jgi:hypothetical protein